MIHHTITPWSLTDDGIFPLAIEASNVYGENNSEIIALVGTEQMEGEFPGECLANARLIAAAPAMAEAIMKAHQMLDSSYHEGHDPRTSTSAQCRTCQIMAILIKALDQAVDLSVEEKPTP